MKTLNMLKFSIFLGFVNISFSIISNNMYALLGWAGYTLASIAHLSEVNKK